MGVTSPRNKCNADSLCVLVIGSILMYKMYVPIHVGQSAKDGWLLVISNVHNLYNAFLLR